MRAVQYDTYGGPEVLVLREVEKPSPTPDEVVIRVRAATVALGDCKARAGLLQRFFSVKFPKIPGRYGAGEVVAGGAGVDYAKAGDRVVFGTDHTENGSCVESIARSREEVAPAPAKHNLDERSAGSAVAIHKRMYNHHLLMKNTSQNKRIDFLSICVNKLN